MMKKIMAMIILYETNRLENKQLLDTTASLSHYFVVWLPVAKVNEFILYLPDVHLYIKRNRRKIDFV